MKVVKFWILFSVGFALALGLIVTNLKICEFASLSLFSVKHVQMSFGAFILSFFFYSMISVNVKILFLFALPSYIESETTELAAKNETQEDSKIQKARLRKVCYFCIALMFLVLEIGFAIFAGQEMSENVGAAFLFVSLGFSILFGYTLSRYIRIRFKFWT